MEESGEAMLAKAREPRTQEDEVRALEEEEFLEGEDGNYEDGEEYDEDEYEEDEEELLELQRLEELRLGEEGKYSCSSAHEHGDDESDEADEGEPDQKGEGEDEVPYEPVKSGAHWENKFLNRGHPGKTRHYGDRYLGNCINMRRYGKCSNRVATAMENKDVVNYVLVDQKVTFVRGDAEQILHGNHPMTPNAPDSLDWRAPRKFVGKFGVSMKKPKTHNAHNETSASSFCQPNQYRHSAYIYYRRPMAPIPEKTRFIRLWTIHPRLYLANRQTLFNRPEEVRALLHSDHRLTLLINCAQTSSVPLRQALRAQSALISPRPKVVDLDLSERCSFQAFRRAGERTAKLIQGEQDDEDDLSDGGENDGGVVFDRDDADANIAADQPATVLFCDAGVNRSVAMAMYYGITRREMTFERALRFIEDAKVECDKTWNNLRSGHFYNLLRAVYSSR